VGEKQTRSYLSEAARRRAWLIGVGAWAVPGLGHLVQRRWVRGLILGGAVWSMFLIGFLLGGHLFTIGGREQGLAVLVPGLWMVGDLGSGLLYVLCWVLNLGFLDTPEAAARVTFEYGNTFLVVAGLLNYLGMLDAFDIAAGRKR
jgi:uncharacterized protein DUF6677